jgi:hypothetical protein
MNKSPAARMTAYNPSYARKMLGNTKVFPALFSAFAGKPTRLRIHRNLFIAYLGHRHTRFSAFCSNIL